LAKDDRPARPVHLEVLLVELASDAPKAFDGVEFSGSARDVTAKVRELQQKGVVTRVKAVQLTTLAGQSASSTTKESRPFVTGIVGPGAGGVGGRGAGGGPGGGPTSRTITYKEVGTSVEVTPEIGVDGLVLLRLSVTDAHMRAAGGGVAVGTDEKGAAVPATEVVTSTVETTLRLRPGHMVLAGGTKGESQSGQAQRLVLVRASTEEARVKESK
jgi:Flp pilus assembly secretin CpaC